MISLLCLHLSCDLYPAVVPALYIQTNVYFQIKIHFKSSPKVCTTQPIRRLHLNVPLNQSVGNSPSSVSHGLLTYKQLSQRPKFQMKYDRTMVTLLFSNLSPAVHHCVTAIKKFDHHEWKGSKALQLVLPQWRA